MNTLPWQPPAQADLWGKCLYPCFCYKCENFPSCVLAKCYNSWDVSVSCDLHLRCVVMSVSHFHLRWVWLRPYSIKLLACLWGQNDSSHSCKPHRGRQRAERQHPWPPDPEKAYWSGPCKNSRCLFLSVELASQLCSDHPSEVGCNVCVKNRETDSGCPGSACCLLILFSVWW